MKFFTHTLFDHKWNEEILHAVKEEPVDEKLIRYISNWPRHATRMNSNRMPKIMLNYGPNGRRRLGGTLKSLLYENETGLSRAFAGWLMMGNMMMMMMIQSFKTITS